MLFSLFVRNADMPAGLSFLQIFNESSKCRLISFALITQLRISRRIVINAIED